MERGTGIMNKIHLVMPMGGGGTRFCGAGFEQPKPLIRLQGKPFFYWAVQSVVKFIDVADLIFVVLQEHVDKFAIDREIKAFYPQAAVRVIPCVLNGAVLTCLEGVKGIRDDAPVLFNDCDHAFFCRQFYGYCGNAEFSGPDGALLTFHSDHPGFSYVKTDKDGNVTGTVEKKVVSSEAVCGAYYFKNRTVFEDAAEAYLTKCEYQEFFMSGLYNEMAAKGQKVTTFCLDAHISFGTPQEYRLAADDRRLGELAG